MRPCRSPTQPSRYEQPIWAATLLAGGRLYCGLPSSSIHRRVPVEFFNLKKKQKVQIPDNELKKRRSVRTTSGGQRQERYAAIAAVHEAGKPLQPLKALNN